MFFATARGAPHWGQFFPLYFSFYDSQIQAQMQLKQAACFKLLHDLSKALF
jgi:hypothetical protein